MKLAGIQKLLVCNPFRVYLQRTFEAPRVCNGLTLACGSSCIEIGCGCGAGALCINRSFECSRLVCVDSDPAMIGCARSYIARPPQWAHTIRTDNISFACEDATRLPYPDESFAAAFLFGVLNSIQDWRRVIAEVFRVLEHGGVFAFKEGLRPETFFHWGRLSGFIPHITEDELRTCLGTTGFSISRFDVVRHLPGCFVRAIKA
jgi:27-O-demethylrifamycin SV methyltransferase